MVLRTDKTSDFSKCLTPMCPVTHPTNMIRGWYYGHKSLIQLPKVADRPGPRGAVGQSWGGCGAAGPLVGPAGVGSGAGIAGGRAIIGAPRGRQKQQQVVL